MTIRALLKLLDIGDVRQIRFRGIRIIAPMMTHDATQRCRWFVQKRRSEIRNASDALVRVVMKQNEPALAIEVQTEHRSLLFRRGCGPVEPARGRRYQHPRI